ncbi:MAG: cytochrome c peroxidase [Tannerellaceae bacterium]
MKSKSSFIYSLSCLALLAGTVSMQSCKTKAEQQQDKAQLTAQLMEDKGCLVCHSEEAVLPFYASFPVIGDQVRKDVKNGKRFVDLQQVVDQLKSGGAVSEVDLSKIEFAMLGGTMPPAKYKMVHWGSSLSNDEKALIIDWARENRNKLYAQSNIAAEFINEPIRPLPDAIAYNDEKAQLGFKLYHDTRLSVDNSISCASCHDLDMGGVDRKQFSEGVNGQFGGVNAPTVYNAALNFVQFWDGRAADLQAQAGGPPLNPIEMASENFDQIVAKLSADAAFKSEFEAVYPEGLSENTITDAIAEFEKTLITPNSRFDKYLKGDKNALSAHEVEGYELFKENKCASCHTGINMGGQSFEAMGITADYFADRGTDITDGDHGRFSVTKNESDMHKFKTPTLRNVALTAPYFHDGSKQTLKEAVEAMAIYQTGKTLDATEVDKIVLYLNSLTGELNGKSLEDSTI